MREKQQERMRVRKRNREDDTRSVRESEHAQKCERAEGRGEERVKKRAKGRMRERKSISKRDRDRERGAETDRSQTQGGACVRSGGGGAREVQTGEKTHMQTDAEEARQTHAGKDTCAQRWGGGGGERDVSAHRCRQRKTNR